MKKVKMFKIIRFQPANIWYYPANIELPLALLKTKPYVKHPNIEIELGQSRVGGPIVDLPKDKEYPEGFIFVAQLDLSMFSNFDEKNLLPKTGQLYFFANKNAEKCKVFYSTAINSELVRVIKEHDGFFWYGCLIGKIYNETESFAERYHEENKTDESCSGWDYFEGAEKSKIYGIYTHCQLQEEDIKEITNSDNILLLQIGEDFMSEGVLSIIIKKKDLHELNFDNCNANYGAS